MSTHLWPHQCVDGAEARWREKAVLALTAKLTPEAVDDLKRALATRDGQGSKCVVITRNQDGRVQVMHKKSLPHVLYCAVWRWSDVTSHRQLRAIPGCHHPFEAKLNVVCVNPYHYERTAGGSNAKQNGKPIGLGFQVQQQQVPVLQDYPMESYEDLPTSPGLPADLQDLNLNQFDVNPLLSSDSESSSLDTCSADRMLTSDHVSSNRMLSSDHVVLQQLIAQSHLVRCKLKYFEQRTRVGDEFVARGNDVVVDGFTAPLELQKGDRFCLGQLLNPERNEDIDKARKHIGNGVRLHFDASSSLSIECLSRQSVFVQSPQWNALNGASHANVVKILPNDNVQMFSMPAFKNDIQVKEGNYDALSKLTDMCVIRLSFVKGWGATYRRCDATDTPCWLEIHLTQALNALDGPMKRANPPNNFITSNS